jgi:hypothetical protein
MLIMRREIQVLALIMVVLSTSGCAAIQDKCGGVLCADLCSGDTRLHGGVCVDGECKYVFEVCELGCHQGACNPQPPHLVFEENEQVKGNFTVKIMENKVTLGDEKMGEEDWYDFYLEIKNAGESGSIFSIKGASIVAETGIMHSTVGFGWSDFIPGGENRNISFTIGEVPPGLRSQNTTIVIRTNQGNYYYHAILATS